jgi:hypothetical protein
VKFIHTETMRLPRPRRGNCFFLKSSTSVGKSATIAEFRPDGVRTAEGEEVGGRADAIGIQLEELIQGENSPAGIWALPVPLMRTGESMAEPWVRSRVALSRRDQAYFSEPKGPPRVAGHAQDALRPSFELLLQLLDSPNQYLSHCLQFLHFS